MLNYSLKLNGNVLSDEQKKCVIGLTLKRVDTGSCSLTVEMNDPNMNYVGDINLFKENVPVEYTLECGNEVTKFSGYIAQLEPDFPDTGVPNITITCMDESYPLDRKKHTKNWGNKKRHVIAKEIFTKYGLKTKIDTSVDKPNTSDSNTDITQSNETDITFLNKLAGEEADDWLCYVENGVGYYCRKKLLETPQEILQYKTGECNLQTFKPTISTATKRVPVFEQDIDLVTGEVKTLNSTVTKNKQGK